MLIVCLIGCLFFVWASWSVLKDMTSPPFILSAIWSVIYGVLILRWNYIEFESIYYCSFLIGLCCFCLGFFLLVDHSGRKGDFVKPKIEYKFRYRLWFTNILVILVFVTIFIVMQKIRVLFVDHYVVNPWQTISQGKINGDFTLGTLLLYAKNLIIAFFAVSAAVFFQNPIRENRRLFFLLLCFALLFAFVATNRGGFFLIILSTFFLYLFYNNFDAKKTRRIFFGLTLALLSIFVLSTFWKFVYEDQSDSTSFLLKMFRIYFSLSPIAFVEWIQIDHELLMGDHTFRFFFAILQDFGFDVEVLDVKQEFVQILDDETNVYTVLHYYAADFGIIYAFVMQFVFGLIYGKLYKNSFLVYKPNLFSRVMLALLFFPLINQFFDDKYLSITSTWLQLFFWVWFISKTCIIEKEE